MTKFREKSAYDVLDELVAILGIEDPLDDSYEICLNVLEDWISAEETNLGFSIIDPN